LLIYFSPHFVIFPDTWYFLLWSITLERGNIVLGAEP